jgi:hypothetical protein
MGLLNDKKYIKKHLNDYILFQLNQGYEAKDIKNLLINYGYSKEIIEDIFKNINLNNYKINKNKNYSKKKLTNELENYLKELIIDFILKELEQGYSLDSIKKALINYGHDKILIDEAILGIKKNNVKNENFLKITAQDLLNINQKKSHLKSTNQKNPFILNVPVSFNYFMSIIIIFICIIFLIIKTNSSIGIVFLSFFPSITAVSFAYFISIKYNKNNENLLKIMPLFSALLSIIIFVGLIKIIESRIILSEPIVILALNFVLSLVLSIYICLFSYFEENENFEKKLDNLNNNNNLKCDDELFDDNNVFKEIKKEELKLEKLIEDNALKKTPNKEKLKTI